jgi:dsDNA-binding SOS-regulon protein
MEINPSSYSFITKTKEVEVKNLQIVKLSAFEKDDGETILLNVERRIKELISGLAKRDINALTRIGLEIEEDEIKHLPTSITGIMVYYLIEGIARDYNIEFDKKPKSIKTTIKGMSNIKTRKRFITKEQKNELLEKTKISHYDKQLTSGVITLPEVLEEIKKAYEEKKHYESIGLIMPENKTDYPQYIGVDYKTPDKDKSPEQIIKEEEIISQINERIIELASSGLITLPKQERRISR